MKIYNKIHNYITNRFDHENMGVVYLTFFLVVYLSVYTITGIIACSK